MTNPMAEAETIDTSGSVDEQAWSDLSPFAQSYIAALFEALVPKDKNDRPLSIGSAVRIVTGETGVVMGLFPRRLKSLNVLTARDFGGTYGGWEVEAITEDGCDWYCEAQREEMFGRVATTSGQPLRFSDLSPEALALILEDCANFENFSSGLGFKTGEVEGRRFWIGRANGQLTGAWAAAFPPLRVYLDDAGKVRLSAEEAQ